MKAKIVYATTRLYKFLKRLYYSKGLRESVKKYVRHCPQCQTTNLQTPHYGQHHLETPQTLIDFISIDLIGPFETTVKGNQYTLTVNMYVNKVCHMHTHTRYVHRHSSKCISKRSIL